MIRSKIIAFLSVVSAFVLLAIVFIQPNHIQYVETSPSASAVEYDDLPSSLSSPQPPEKLPSSLSQNETVPNISVVKLPIEKPKPKLDRGLARRYDKEKPTESKPHCIRHTNRILGTGVTICDEKKRTRNSPEYKKSGGLIGNYRSDFLDALE